VVGHEGKCKQLHGHQYDVRITAVSNQDQLDSLGRVIDFSVIKEKVGKWIDDNFDHGFILWSEDGDAIKAIANVPDSKYFLLPSNPTAENIAWYLLHEVCPSLLADYAGIKITKITLWETENCYAEVTRED